MTVRSFSALRHAGPPALLALLLLSGCVMFEDNVSQGYATNKDFDGSKISFTTADVRTVISRNRFGDDPQNNQNKKIICSEPSPDIAMAIAMVSKLSADRSQEVSTTVKEFSGSAKETMGVTAEHNLTQTLTQLVGRSVAVQALRDGTFRACEAYANGAIDKDEYALILSQYGDVLSTLILAENAEKSKIDAVAGNYVAYSLPRLTHAMFVACVQNKKIATKGQVNPNNEGNPFLDRFCESFASQDGLKTIMADMQPTPYSAPAADKAAKDDKAATAAVKSWTVEFTRTYELNAVEAAKIKDAATALTTALKTDKTATLKIVGHATETPPPPAGTTNEGVALKRAETVMNILVNAHQIDSDKIDPSGDAKSEPKRKVAVITLKTAPPK
ncbi:OmpA family protein [Phaeospirillum tilakii]|uniref:OmpA family protein n=1 Tax=Phaeospirillum tilakii TaxID=741673 RepID=A0ABW5CBG5_9PROT